MQHSALRRLAAWSRTLPARLALLSLFLVVPICGLAAWQYRELDRSIVTTRLEERGFAYIAAAVDVLRSTSDFGANPTPAARTAVERDLGRLDERAASLRAAGVDAPSGLPLQAPWRRLREAPGTPDNAALAAFGDAILRAVNDVADSSRLAFDAHVDAGELGDALDNPYILEFERVSAAERTARAGLARGGPPIEGRIAIAGDLALARSAEEPLGVDMRGAFEADPALRGRLQGPWLEAASALAALDATLDGILHGAPASRAEATRLSAQDVRMRASAQRFTAALTNQLGELLEARIIELRIDRRKLIGAVILAFLISLGVILLIGRVTARRDRRELLRAQADSRALTAELARQRVERALLLTEAQFRAVFERSRMGIALLGGDGATLESNAALAAILGEDAAPLATPADANFAALVEGRQATYQSERRLSREGRPIWVEIAISPVTIPEPESVVAIAMVSDITERKASNERLKHAATHDELTHLPNRAEFMRALGDELAGVGRGARFAVLFIDLDDFKLINDTLGHHAGDRVLSVAAQRIRNAGRPSDVVARFHGDEFGVLLRETDAAGARAVAERILNGLRAPIAVGGEPVFVRSSIGIVAGGTAYGDAEDVLRDADAAMYHAKSLGGSQAAVFDLEMHEKLAQRIGIVNDLRHGIERGEFEVVYQPVVQLATGSVVSLEALLRWNHPERGEIAPADFIPLAEESGAILELGRFALDQACDLLARLDRLGPSYAQLAINVNLSVAQITQGNVAETVRHALASSGLPAERLMLEITESALLENGARAIALLDELKELGVRLCVDDFGMGYSSLAYLHQFPIDALKIDRSFVTGRDGDLANPSIVDMLLRLADSLGIVVVAEGVTTETQRSRLLAAGCAFGQGFLFSQALAAPDVIPWLAGAEGASRKPAS